MVNTMYCDVCNHEYKCYKKNTFKPTNTNSIFSDKYLHLSKKQNIVKDVILIFFLKNDTKHLQSSKHNKNEETEGATKFSIENTDGAFKGQIKISVSLSRPWTIFNH